MSTFCPIWVHVYPIWAAFLKNILAIAKVQVYFLSRERSPTKTGQKVDGQKVNNYVYPLFLSSDTESLSAGVPLFKSALQMMISSFKSKEFEWKGKARQT